MALSGGAVEIGYLRSALIGLCGALLPLGGWCGKSGAAEWSMAPSLSVKGEYNSNLLLFDGDNEVWGHWVSPGVTFKGATESLTIDGGVRGDDIRYYGQQERKLTNLFFPLRMSYASDRHRFGFEGGFTRDNTLMGELQKTGLVLSFTQRNLWTASPSWTIGLTERLSWQAGYQFMDAHYENGRRLGLVDYRVHAGVTTVSYRANERDEIQLKGEYATFETPAVSQEWTYYGAGLGLSRSFSESMTASVSGGARVVNARQDFPGGSLTERGVVWLYEASLRNEFEQTSVVIEASRAVNPSGFGVLLRTDRVGGAAAYRLNETVTLSIQGALYFVSVATSPLLGGSVPQTRFTSVTPKLTWKFAEWWALDVSYSYAERTVGELSQWNFANSTFVMLTYGGWKWSVSR